VPRVLLPHQGVKRAGLGSGGAPTLVVEFCQRKEQRIFAS
jgi:hypothetical protein